MFSLQSKNAFVTGGTAGIGLAIARNFVSAGANVTISGRRDGSETAREIGAHFRQLDVRDEQGFLKSFEAFVENSGLLDVLVLNAGIVHENSIKDLPADEAKDVFDVNVNGVFYGLKYGQQFMRDGGSIILTSSIVAVLGSPESSVYSASKAAVSSLARSAAIELGSRRIRVNAVCPGGIRTDMAMPGEFFEVLTPLGRIGETDDLVGIYNLLASDASAYITGQQIVVDGGMTAGLTPQIIEKIFS